MIPSAVSSTNSLSTIEFFSRVILEGDPRLYFSRTSASPKPVVIPSITALRKLSWYVVRDWVCSIKTLLFWASKSSTACAKESSSLCYTTLCYTTLCNCKVIIIKFGEILNLEPISLKAWIPYIQGRFETYRKSISEEFVAKICETVQYQSSYVQQYVEPPPSHRESGGFVNKPDVLIGRYSHIGRRHGEGI